MLTESALAGMRRSTQTLAPSIQSLLREVGWRPADIQAIGVTIGPGSFTGLRLGAATAKILSFVIGAAVRGVDTLRVIAAQAPPEAREVVTLLDAGRGEILVGHFRFENAGLPIGVGPTRLISTVDWLAEPHPEALITGPGLRGLVERLPAGVAVGPEVDWEPRAATVARLAHADLSRGQKDDPWTLAPVYYRRSAAEEVWERKQR